MKKKILVLMAAMMTAVMAAGCVQGQGKDIGRDAALEAALQDAGVSESETTRLSVSQDSEDGRKVYEIRFDVEEKEYEYEILASDGQILSSDIDTKENYNAVQEGTVSSEAGNTETAGQTQTSGGNTNASDVAITVEEAIQIALDRVPGASQEDVKIELDFDDGVYKYEGDIIHEQKEYEFEIDANTGTVLQWSEERL